MVAGEEDTATAGDKGGEKQQQQLSISLETKMPPDVVAAVLATKSSSSSSAVEAEADDEIRKAIEKVESKIETEEETEEEIAKEEEEEQRNAVDESLTISMLADEDRESEKSPRDDNDDIKAAKTKAKEEKSRPTFATKVHEDDDRARIDDWVAAVKQQNYQRISSVVYYDDAMPSLDDLLAAREGWSQEFLEEALTTNNTTTSSTSSSGTTIDPDLDLTFEEYAQVICALLGVPIYKGKDGKTSKRSLIQSLHLAMSLYIEVDQGQHTAEQINDGIFSDRITAMGTY